MSKAVIRMAPQFLGNLLCPQGNTLMEDHQRLVFAAFLLAQCYENPLQVSPTVIRWSEERGGKFIEIEGERLERLLVISGDTLEDLPVSYMIPDEFMGFRVDEYDTCDLPGETRKNRLKEWVFIAAGE